MTTTPKNGVGRICAPPLLLAVLALAAFYLPGASAAMQFEPGRWWNVLFCHFAHWTADHLLWDVLAFAALGMFCCRFSAGRFWLAIGLSALAVPFAVVLLQPEITSYRGLSGIDSALFGLVLCEVVRSARRRRDHFLLVAACFAGTAFAGKVLFEFTTGGAVFANSDPGAFVNLPLAHLVGFACGVLAGTAGALGAALCRRHGALALPRAEKIGRSMCPVPSPDGFALGRDSELGGNR